jgi:hypothetical protein
MTICDWIEAHREGWSLDWLPLPDERASVETFAEHAERCQTWMEAPHEAGSLIGYRAWQQANGEAPEPP